MYMHIKWNASISFLYVFHYCGSICISINNINQIIALYNKTILDFCFRSICLFAYLNIHNIDLGYRLGTVQITFIFIDFRVCDFAFAFKTQNAPCVSRFKRVLFSDRFQFAF